MHAYNVDEIVSFYDSHKLLYSVLFVSWSKPGDGLFLREEDTFFSQVRGLSAFSAFTTFCTMQSYLFFLDPFAYISHNFFSFITASKGHGAPLAHSCFLLVNCYLICYTDEKKRKIPSYIRKFRGIG